MPIVLPKQTSASVPTPATSKASIYIETVSGKPYYKNDAGTAIEIGSGYTPPTGTGFVHITAGAQDAAAKLVDTADVADAAITLAKQANMATASVLYRKTAGVGAPEVNTLATLKTDLGLTGTNSGDQSTIVGITGTVAQFNTAITDGDLATGGGTATGTNTGDQVVVGRHMIPIMTGAIQPSVTGGSSAVTSVASAANQPDIVTLDFDATTQEYAQFAIPMPESWDEGTLTFQPIWSHAATATNFGVVWGLQAVAVSDADGIAAAFGTAQTSTDTGGTTSSQYIGPQSAAITVAGTPAAGDMVFFRVYRDPANGSDTLAIDARLHGVRLYMTNNATVD